MWGTCQMTVWIYRAISTCIIVSLLQPAGVPAQQSQQLSKHAAKIERQVSVNALGDEITVLDQQNSAVCGRLSSIRPDSFGFQRVTDGATISLSYDEVRKVTRGCPKQYAHRGTNIGRMIGWIGGPIVIAAVIIVVATAHD
jgi:hypothetical protein